MPFERAADTSTKPKQKDRAVSADPVQKSEPRHVFAGPQDRLIYLRDVSPPATGKKKKRPKTPRPEGPTTTFATNPMYKGCFKTPAPMKVKKVEVQNLLSMVHKHDRLKSQHTIAYMKLLLDTYDRIGEPLDEIETIFDKILKWKKSFGNLD